MDFKDMIHSLIEKAGAAGGDIHPMTLEEVGAWLEQLREQLPEEGESFSELRDLFCQILMESDSQGPSVYAKKISEMFPAEADETALLNEMLAPLSPEYSPMEAVETPEPVWDEFDPIVPPVHDEVHEEIPAETEIPSGEIPPLSDDVVLPIAEAAPATEEAVAEISVPDPIDIIPSEQLEAVPEVVEEEETPTQMMPLPPADEILVQAPAPIPPPAAEPIVESLPEVVAVAPAPVATPIPPAPTGKFHSAPAEEAHQMAILVAQMPHRPAKRLGAELICDAIEMEANAVLAPKIAYFWSVRGQEVRPMLEDSTKRIDLHPELKKALDALASSDTEGLYDIPFASLLGALKFFLSLPTPEGFKPTLSECATLFLLFGQHRKLETLSLKNVLGVQNITAGEITELAARLMRLSRWKTRTQNLWGEEATDWMSDIQSNVDRVLELLHQLKTGTTPE